MGCGESLETDHKRHSFIGLTNIDKPRRLR